MIFKKKSLLLLGILILSIVAINTFVFPKIAENCSCYMGEEVENILCKEFCPSGDCDVMQSLGRCVDGSCVTSHYIRCLGSTTYLPGYWSEPCWQCLPGAY